MIYSAIPVYGIVSLSSDIVRIRHVQEERLALCKPVGVHNWILNDRFPIGAIQAELSNATNNKIKFNFQLEMKLKAKRYSSICSSGPLRIKNLECFFLIYYYAFLLYLTLFCCNIHIYASKENINHSLLV